MLHLTINQQSPNEAALREAAHIIKNGGIAVYPTETVYGLGIIFDNESALERLFAAKGRKETKPVLLLIESLHQLDCLAAEIPPEALLLAQRWWPGPLTMLFKALPSLSLFLTGDDGKVACRVSSDAVAQRIVQLVGSPITSTSANLAGGASASRIADMPDELLVKVDVLIDAGATPGGPASTLLDVSVRPFKIVREGAIPSEKLF